MDLVKLREKMLKAVDKLLDEVSGHEMTFLPVLTDAISVLVDTSIRLEEWIEAVPAEAEKEEEE
jgi:hypothetical protein